MACANVIWSNLTESIPQTNPPIANRSPVAYELKQAELFSKMCSLLFLSLKGEGGIGKLSTKTCLPSPFFVLANKSQILR